MNTDIPRLVHYTCADFAPKIARAGILRPNALLPLIAEPLVWATDLRTGDVPDLAAALGLAQCGPESCDRTIHHFEVTDPSEFQRWTVYASRQVRAGKLLPEARELLDATPGGMPRHWWLATRPVRIAVPAVTR